MNKLPRNIIAELHAESLSYKSIQDIEKLVETGGDLSAVPVQPLYLALTGCSVDQIAELLPKLSKKQRQALIDIDMWKKDNIDVNQAVNWPVIYSRVEDLALIADYAQSNDFLLYLKAVTNIYTFDLEDPQYPDHDNFFLTDDNFFLIEYSEKYPWGKELQFIIKNLYGTLGIEKSHQCLMSLVVDSFLVEQEDLYQDKKERLRDFGFVDYYEALEKLSCFYRLGDLDSFIIKKNKYKGRLESDMLNQTLHSSTVAAFNDDLKAIQAELAQIDDEGHLDFLHFNFVRLINSTITLHDALRAGRVEMTKVGRMTKHLLELGHEYIKSKIGHDENIFYKFDFFDLYKTGKTLIEINQKKIKKAITGTPFEQNEEEYFLGTWWQVFLDDSFKSIVESRGEENSLKAKAISNLELYNYWVKQTECFVHSIPYILQFHATLKKLRDAGSLRDDFYLNYQVENIDVEAILISSIINFERGYYESENALKMGVSITELRAFFNKYFQKTKDGYTLNELSSKEMKELLFGYAKRFGMDQIPFIAAYMHRILQENLSGYDFDTLTDEEFLHVGGPILLNVDRN